MILSCCCGCWCGNFWQNLRRRGEQFSPSKKQAEEPKNDWPLQPFGSRLVPGLFLRASFIRSSTNGFYHLMPSAAQKKINGYSRENASPIPQRCAKSSSENHALFLRCRPFIFESDSDGPRYKETAAERITQRYLKTVAPEGKKKTQLFIFYENRKCWKR